MPDSATSQGLEHRLAFSTNAYLNFSFADAVARLAKIGYNGVEIMADVPHAWPAFLLPEQKQGLRDALAKNGLAISNVNAFMMHAVNDPRQHYWRPSWIETLWWGEPAASANLPCERALAPDRIDGQANHRGHAEGGRIMPAADDFRNQFDEAGRYRSGDGVSNVVFATMGGSRFPGRLHFKNGLCVRAELERGGDWGLPDESPLSGARFLLHVGEDKPQGIAIYEGRVFPLEEVPARKRDFLANVRIARNLFVHPRVEADSPSVDAATTAGLLARAAIWLTPKSVAGFDPADFSELGPARQQELQTAVQNFLAVAKEVPAQKAPTGAQYDDGSVAFLKVLQILEPYLPMSDEAGDVEKALRKVDFPPWMVNWDYELGSDSDGVAAVWVNVFADETALPRGQLGRAVEDLTSKIRQAFAGLKIERWPYIRLKTALEHKAG